MPTPMSSSPARATCPNPVAADLIIANGLGFEPWLERLWASGEARGRRIDASAGVLPL